MVWPFTILRKTRYFEENRASPEPLMKLYSRDLDRVKCVTGEFETRSDSRSVWHCPSHVQRNAWIFRMQYGVSDFYRWISQSHGEWVLLATSRPARPRGAGTYRGAG